jgi:hypothetical protein
MPVGRHRHAINVRADGLASVLGTLMQDAAVQAALLVDVDSGMVLDACGPQFGGAALDQEQLGAAHGELMRLALGPAFGVAPHDPVPLDDCEIVVALGGGRHLVLGRVPDPHGDRLVLSVLVCGPARAVRRARRRLREVSAAALTAGPTVSLRPVEGAWVPGVTEERPEVRARPMAGPLDTSPLRVGAGPMRVGPMGVGPMGVEPARIEPVGGSALAALDAPVPPRPVAARVPDPLPPVHRMVAAESESRPAPPSALPPPAQRTGSD